MKVLLTTDAVGGVWTYAITLARALLDGGDDCVLAVLGRPTEAQAAAIPEGVEWEWAEHRLEWDRATDADIAAATRWLEALARHMGADVVHLNQFAYAVGRFDPPVMVVAHSDAWSWHSEVRDALPSAEWAPYHRWVADGLRAADVVVAPTRYQSELLARHYGRAADRVIHNGMAVVGGERLRASRRGSVLTVGRAWDEAKGVGVLEEALSGLGPDAPSAHLAGALVGPRGERFRPRRLYAHGRLPGGAMGRLYDNAAVYVAASLYEPFGLAPLEAAMHGCALLLTAIGSFRELWSGAAAFMPAGDPVVLGERLLELLEDGSRLDGLAAAARARALDRYTVAHMTTRYRDLYREMREGTGAPAGGGAALESPTRNEEEEG